MAQKSVNNEECDLLERDLKNAYESRLFTDFSFDYRGIKAMETLSAAKRLKWNTWNVEAEDFDAIIPQRFGMVIFNNRDPNNR